MTKTFEQDVTRSGALSFQPILPKPPGSRATDESAPEGAGQSYLIRAHDDATSRVLEAVMPMLGRVLQEKTAQARDRKLEELIDLVAAQLVVPSDVDLKMAQRLAERRARLLSEFGHVTAEQLAEANQSRAANRHALADNWKKRGLVFAVRHRDEHGRTREVFPLFQFDSYKPLEVIHHVLKAFGEHKTPWKLALWFTSNNGWLPGQARPVDLLTSAPEAVVEAARRDAAGSAA